MTSISNTSAIVDRKAARAAYQRQWYLRNREKRKAQATAYYRANKAKSDARSSVYHQERAARIKLEVFSYYTGLSKPSCVCGETRVAALTIDHIGGGGGVHRKLINKGGCGFYRWLQVNGYPPGYRVLCMNCNYRAHASVERDLSTNPKTVALRKRNIEIKKELFERLGNVCTKCQIADLDLLTVHHIRNDGAAHRAALGVPSGYHFYRALLRSGDLSSFPIECRCFNCNCAEAWE